MISNFISVKTILAKLYRDLNINKEINENSIIEWVAECLLKIGAYSQFQEISTCIELDCGKAKLPCGFYKLVDISYNNRPLHWATNTIAMNYQCDGCSIPKCCTDYNFYINDSYLITNITDTNTLNHCNKLCMVYLGIIVDDEGYPMIPDDVYFLEACAKYCTYMLDYQDWRKGQLTDKVFQKSEQDYLWYVRSAKGAANMPNAAQLENLKNIMIRLIPHQNEYNKHFKGMNNEERRKRY